MRYRAIAALVVLCVPASAHDSGLTQIAGPHRFSLGDELAWAAPDYDDSDWEEIQIPGGWIAQGFAKRPYVGWYRTHFRWHSNGMREPALLVSPIRSAYEVYLNGEKIGGVGGIGRRYFWSSEPRARVYSVPRALLKPDEDNLLAIRVQRIVTDGGMRTGQLSLGEEADLRLEHERRLYVTLAWEAGFLIFYGSTLLYSLLLWVLGFREPRHFWFAIVILQIGMGHLANSNILGLTFGASYGWAALAVLVEQCFPLSTLMFLKHTFQRKIGPRLQLTFVPYVLLCVLWWWNIDTKNELYMPWTLIATFVFGPVGLAWCVEGKRKGHPDALPLLIGSAGLILLLTLYYAWSWSVLGQYGEHLFRSWYVPHEWYAWLCIHLSMIYTLAAGYERAQRGLRRMSVGVLQAHEDERRRIARDLHDGIGQILSSLKLRLDAVKANRHDDQHVVSQLVSQSAAEAEKAFDELRRVTSGLHPEALQRRGLVDAVRDLSIRMSKHGQMQINVYADEGLDAGAVRGADHIYRVVQEAANNALRHSGATEIDIRFRRNRRELLVTIADNGKGFDVGSIDWNVGIGLASMRERLHLLGGKFSLESDQSGTIVTLENLPL